MGGAVCGEAFCMGGRQKNEDVEMEAEPLPKMASLNVSDELEEENLAPSGMAKRPHE
jgi:hypothetical protein